jgi:hypothetical protein
MRYRENSERIAFDAINEPERESMSRQPPSQRVHRLTDVGRVADNAYNPAHLRKQLEP